MEFAAVKSVFREQLDDGARCPCCEKFAKRYRRSFNQNMASALLWLIVAQEEAEGDFVDVPGTAPRWLLRSNQLSTLRWWGLVSRAKKGDDEKGYSGLWRPSLKGIRFATGEISIPGKAITYDGEIEGFEGDYVHVDDFGGLRWDRVESRLKSSARVQDEI